MYRTSTGWPSVEDSVYKLAYKFIARPGMPGINPGQSDYPMPGGKSSRTKGEDSKISEVA
jgi:hypothetical protein